MSTPHDDKPQPATTHDTPSRFVPGHITNGRELLEEDISASASGYPSVPASPPPLHHLKPTTTNGSSVFSSGRAREESHRREDNIELVKAEHVARKNSERSHGDLLYRSGSRKDAVAERPETPIDELDDRTNPVHNSRKKSWRPPAEPSTSTAKFFKKIHESSVFIRYFTYIVPVALILLIPLLLGALLFKDATVGGVDLMWFMIWLEVVWLSLWCGRVVSKLIPYPVGVLASVVTNGSKKWRDMATMLEVPATLFFWWLSIYASFLPIMQNNRHDGSRETKYWERNANIVLLCLFIGAILNLIQKILIQLLAISFHIRTYQDRIEINKFQIASLAKLYKHAKDMERDLSGGETERSGTVTPKMALAQGAQRFANRFVDMMGKIAGDFTGKQINSSTSPHQVVITLLRSTEGCNVLARRLYRAFVRPEEEHVHDEDLRGAFSDDEEAEAAFFMFDRDLNGDISCEEMELSCGEIGRERKAISASLKDLDSVVGKFDDCLTFVVFVIVIMLFLSLISRSTAGVLTSASSSILALSWLFSATAQEFLASLIFVFVKHPFDVGDRVEIINTGIGTTESFYIREIALMYTEMKKLTGEIVQAPNSLLNTLFILNMRRSGGLAEPIPITVKFGTSIEQIDLLRERMLEFVKSEKREYQGKIITELIDMPDMHAVKINVVFFYKSNWQNELVRLHRRNKFMCTLMANVAELGMESPNMRWPGQKMDKPVFLQNVNTDTATTTVAQPPPRDEDDPSQLPRTSSTRSSRKVDLSLGAKDMASSDDTGDVFEDRSRYGRRGGMVPLKRVVEEDGDSVTSGHGFHRRRTMTKCSLDSGSTTTNRRNWFWKQQGDEEMGMGTGVDGGGRGVPLSPQPIQEEVEMNRL